MVVQLRRGGEQSPAFDTLLTRLDGLVIDMKAIRDGQPPQQLGGVDAPILDRWTPSIGNNMFLVVLATGHPQFVGEDRLITTSQLFLISDDQAWARTLSRWCRLGREVSRTELVS